MNLFENLQLFKESNSNEPEEIIEWDEDVFDDQYDGFDDVKHIKTEGVTDIVAKIKNWFVQNKNNRMTKEIQAKIEADGGDIEAFFKNLVPTSGKADTKAGELIRAIMKLLYRDYNDGDVYFSGYGIETCGEAASYLVDKGFESLIEFAEEHKDEDIYDNPNFENIYTQFLNDLADEVIDEIRDTPTLLIEPNDEDMLKWPSEDWKEYEFKYEYEVEFNDAVQRHVDNGNIDIDDIEYEISTWEYCNNIEQEWGSLIIKDLTHDEFEELNHSFWKWMEEYGNQLDEEYGVGEEEYDEEEDW